jgi:hypothetical protein
MCAMIGWRVRFNQAMEYSVSWLGATTVLSVGLVNRRTFENWLTGPPPLPSGTFTLVLVRNTRLVSSSGIP